MKKGVFLIVLAGMLWGTAGIFVNFLAPFGFSSQQMTTTRLFLAFLILFLYCLLFRRDALRVRTRDLILYIVCGISLFGTAAFYYESMQLTSMSISVMLMYISPVSIMLISVLFLGERFSLKKGIAVVTMLVGCALVVGLMGGFKPNFLGVVMGLLSAAAYTVYNIFTKVEAKRGIDPLSSTLYAFLFAALSAVAFSKPWEIPALIGQEPLSILPVLLIHSLCTCLVPYFLYSISLKDLSVGAASAMSIVEPMSGALIGVIFYQEKLTAFTVCGIVLIIFSVLLLGMSEGEKKAS